MSARMGPRNGDPAANGTHPDCANIKRPDPGGRALTREAQGKSLLGHYHQQRQALNRYCVGAFVLSEPIILVIRRELKGISPDVKIDVEEIDKVLRDEVIKREVLEGDKATEVKKKVAKAASKMLRARAEKDEGSETAPAESEEPVAPPGQE